MGPLLSLAKRIDAVTERMGRLVLWLSLIMVLVGAFNAVARWAAKFIGINLSSNALLELQWQSFSVLFLLGGAYALKLGAHVRVDVLYGRLSTRKRAWINFLGTVFFLIPFAVFLLLVSWPMVYNSWSIWEQSPDPGGLPVYPIKTFLLIGFAFLLIQGFAEAVKHLAVLVGHEGAADEAVHVGEGL